MKIIIKTEDNGIKIVTPNSKKFGPEYKEIMKEIEEDYIEYEDIEVDKPVFVDGETTYQKEIVRKKVKKTRTKEVLDYVIRPYSELEVLKGLSEDQWFLTDQEIDKSDLESRKQLYVDGETIKKDLDWEKRLMPDQLIKKKEIAGISKKMKTETDPVKIAVFMSDLEEIKSKEAGIDNEEKYWAEKALAGLDRAEKDKPEVRTKLEQKIQDLS